jgi:hypothetical protein
VIRLQFDADDLLLASSRLDGSFQLWDWESGQIQRRAPSGTAAIAMFCPPDQVVSGLQLHGSMQQWDVSAELDAIEARRISRLMLQSSQTLVGHQSRVTSVAFVDENRLISGSDDFTVRHWNLKTGQSSAPAAGHSSHVRGIAVDQASDRFYSVSEDGSLREWSFNNPPDGTQLSQCGSPLFCCAISPDGRRLAMSGSGGSIWLWDRKNARIERSWVSHSSSIECVALSRSGKWLATCGWEGAVIWDPETGDRVASIPIVGVLAVAFSFDDRALFVADTEGKLGLWSVDTCEQKTCISAHLQAISALAVSPDGTLLASACRDGILKIWDATTLQALSSQAAHPETIRTVTFSPSGRQLATAGHDSLIRIWPIPENPLEEIKKRAAEWGRYPTTRPRAPRGARCLELSIY